MNMDTFHFSLLSMDPHLLYYLNCSPLHILWPKINTQLVLAYAKIFFINLTETEFREAHLNAQYKNEIHIL